MREEVKGCFAVFVVLAGVAAAMALPTENPFVTMDDPGRDFFRLIPQEGVEGFAVFAARLRIEKSGAELAEHDRRKQDQVIGRETRLEGLRRPEEGDQDVCVQNQFPHFQRSPSTFENDS